MNQNFLKSDRIRVLINGIHAKSGGGITYLRNILPILAQDTELEVHLFIHFDQFKLFGLMDENIRLHLLTFRNGFFSNLLWEQISLPILARYMSVDVTISPANYGPILAPSTIIMLRNSLAVASKETRPIKRLYWGGLALMTGLSLLTCRRAIAVSEYARQALTFKLGKKLQNKIDVIHHGVSENFKPSRNTAKEKFLLAVSDIYVQKNLHTMALALVNIRKEYPDIILKIAGKPVDLGYLKELNYVLEKNGLTDCIEFLGEQNDKELLMLYQNCLLFVFPSTVETFGNPLVEAMSCGAPIVCSNTSVMPEIMGDAGRYFDPLNVSDIAETVISLLSDEIARKNLSLKAIQRSKRFSWLGTAKKTAKVIKSVTPIRYNEIISNQRHKIS
jgi:glycosyltransferase involved in cell wall biosynthesis